MKIYSEAYKDSPEKIQEFQDHVCAALGAFAGNGREKEKIRIGK